MTYTEMRVVLNRVQRQQTLSPAEEEILDVLHEMLTALETQNARIQELALAQLGVPIKKTG